MDINLNYNCPLYASWISSQFTVFENSHQTVSFTSRINCELFRCFLGNFFSGYCLKNTFWWDFSGEFKPLCLLYRRHFFNTVVNFSLVLHTNHITDHNEDKKPWKLPSSSVWKKNQRCKSETKDFLCLRQKNVLLLYARETDMKVLNRAI